MSTYDRDHMGCERVQDKPPQNVPLYHVDYIDLKWTKVQKTQEEIFISPFTAWKNLEVM